MKRHFRRSTRTTLVGVGLVLLATGCISTTPVTPATPEPGPPSVPARPATVSAVKSTMWQTNGAVWALATRGGKLYAGGDFTRVRPPGSAPGSNEVDQVRLARFDASTGEYDQQFDHSTDARVSTLAVSPDGDTLYLGGDFVYVDGQRRNKVAAIDLTTNQLLPWAPAIGSGNVRAITVSADSSTVYVGGSFSSVNGAARSKVAKLTAATGAVDPSWAPSVDGVGVYALLLTPDQQRLIVGGNFENVNGAHHRALASVNVAGGSSGPMADMIRSCGAGCATRSDVKTLTTDGSRVYVGAEGTGGGWFDGTLAVDPTTGKQIWYDNCLGATQGIAALNGVLYVGSHAHDCTPVAPTTPGPGGFGQAPFQNGPSSWHHLMAEQTSGGQLLDWFPTTNPGPTEATTDKDELGPRAMVTDGTSVFVGGHFTRINGAAQQGLTRFTPSGPRATPAKVTSAAASLLSGGRAVLKFNGVSDPDSGTLTYRVYRDGRYTSPVATFSNVWAHFWQTPLLTVRDSGLTAGSHFYEVDAVDESGQVTRSGRFTASVTGVGYRNAVAATGPAQYWRLDDTSGTTAVDASGRNRPGAYSGSLNRNVPGAVPTGRAVHLGGTGSVYTDAPAQTSPNTYTLELWLRTTTRTGGRIAGFGNAQSGASSQYDRQLYMNNSGQLLFGIWNKGPQVTWTPESYNDGYWHHVVAMQDPKLGVRLFVDGQQVAFMNSVPSGATYSGWWRLGADNNNKNWTSAPSSNGFNGDVDEFAVYPTTIGGAAARTHMTAE